MQMLYNSDQYAVVVIELSADPAAAVAPVAVPPDAEPATPSQVPRPARGGYEIVDKLARKEIFIDGALAERFQRGVQQLVDQGPTEEALDAFIADYAGMAQQPLVLH